MKSEMSKAKHILFIIALFLTNVAIMADMVIVPASASLYKVFGNHINLVNFILSGACLTGVVASLIAGKLLQRVSKRALIITAFSMFVVCSVFGGVIENVYYIAVMRALTGFSYGLIMVASPAMLTAAYPDEKKRSTMMGAFNCAGTVIGATLSTVAGIMAAQSWKSVFLVYLVGIPILVLLIAFIPKTAVEKKAEHDKNLNSKDTRINPVKYGSLALAAVFLNAIYMIAIYLIGVYVTEQKIGDASLTGVLSALGTVGSACACAIFGITYRKLGRACAIPSYILIAICYSLLLFFPNPVVAIIACTLMGAAYGSGFTFYYMRSTVIVHPSKISISLALMSAASGLGGFFSTYLISGLQSALGLKTIASTMPYLIGMSAVAAILSIALTLKDSKQPSEHQSLKEGMAD